MLFEYALACFDFSVRVQIFVLMSLRANRVTFFAIINLSFINITFAHIFQDIYILVHIIHLVSVH